jgi:hypothetical protein
MRMIPYALGVSARCEWIEICVEFCSLCTGCNAIVEIVLISKFGNEQIFVDRFQCRLACVDVETNDAGMETTTCLDDVRENKIQSQRLRNV